MAEENDPGKFLMTIGMLAFWIPLSMELRELWFISVIGAIIFVFGVIVKASTSTDTLSRTAAVGINQHLPTSRAVDFFETVVGYADNPDTSTMSIGTQAPGTRPILSGISSAEFVSEAESYSIGVSSSQFQDDEYNEFVAHDHERVLPLDIVDPVTHWYNPVDEWHNPTKYW